MKLAQSIIFILCFNGLLNGQSTIDIKVLDLVSNEALDSVSVELINNKYSETILQGGELSIELFDTNRTTLQGNAFVNSNALYYYFNSEVFAAIYSVNGKIIYSKTGPLLQNTIHLSKELPAICIFRIWNSKYQQSYVLQSVQGKYALGILSNPETDFHNQRAVYDTIYLRKNQYFDRVVPLNIFENIPPIKMVKKNYNELNYFNELPDYNAFSLLKNLPVYSFMSDVESVKVIYDSEADQVYYINTKEFKTHYDFAHRVLGFMGTNSDFSLTQYTTSPDRYLYCATINYYKELNKYVLNFLFINAISCSGINHLYRKITETSGIANNLYFHSNKPGWDNCNAIPVISTQELFSSQNYQAMNQGENYGYLRKFDINTFQINEIGKRDIVVINGLPNNLPVCSGIITTEFQTPLSHINVLSHNRGIPNMVLKDAFTNDVLTDNFDQFVYFKVAPDGFTIEQASHEIAEEFWFENEPHEELELELDTTIYGIVDLKQAGIGSINKIGGKAANFGELLKISNTSGVQIPTPEGAFAIPFYYYKQHMDNSGAQNYLTEILTDSLFYNNQAYKLQCLSQLQDIILDFPINRAFLNLVNQKIEEFPEIDRFRFRSSTNAEDLEAFSGAGLYGSYTGIVNAETGKTIENAIKKVWASLWNMQAFEEREYYMVDQLSVAMGILVHRSFPDEDANGVVVTKNLYNPNHGFVINAQYEDFSIVYPEPGITHDQLILYTKSYEQGQNYSIQYISESNIPELNGEHVLSDSELFTLGDYCKWVKNYYHSNFHPEVNYNNYAVEIEFKVDSKFQPRAIYLKQVRPYN